MNDDKNNKVSTRKINLELSQEVYEALENNLKKIIDAKQLPENTNINQFIELILSNYVQSLKMMGSMGDKFLSDLKDKLEGVFSSDNKTGDDNFFQSIMDNFKNIFNVDTKNEESEEKKAKEKEIKRAEELKKKS